jgi:hypothetical protein
MTTRSMLLMVVLGIAACGNPSQVDDAQVSETQAGLTDRGRTLEIVTRDESGFLATVIDTEQCGGLRHLSDNAFFQPFGTNGRACIHCHAPSAGWTITPELAQLRFTNPLDADDPACLLEPAACRAERNPSKWGRDPLFRPNDGAVSPTADVSTADARLTAYKLLLEKGLIRVGMPIPAGAEFALDAVDDPYHYASAAELSLFRRPLPATNLMTGDGTHTLSAVMWDGRETRPGQSIDQDLATQANDATLGHAQALEDLSPQARQEIVRFESSLHTAQVYDQRAGDLNARGATGGPQALVDQTFFAGINDVLGAPGTFSPDVFNLYVPWEGARDDDRAHVARGEQLFNRTPIAIRGVRGLNDALGVDTIAGTCTSCHDSPNYGHHSVALAIDIGISDASRRSADLPLYTLRNLVTGERLQTSDPGRALVTGKWRDIGKFKGPILRGVAARAPYFHNGSAASLRDVVDFYDQRFGIGFTEQDKRDLVAFLRTL